MIPLVSKPLDFCNPLELLIIRVQPLAIITKRFHRFFFSNNYRNTTSLGKMRVEGWCQKCLLL